MHFWRGLRRGGVGGGGGNFGVSGKHICAGPTCRTDSSGSSTGGSSSSSSTSGKPLKLRNVVKIADRVVRKQREVAHRPHGGQQPRHYRRREPRVWEWEACSSGSIGSSSSAVRQTPDGNPVCDRHRTGSSTGSGLCMTDRAQHSSGV